MTLGHVGEDGRRRERTLFFKRNPNDSREAERYRFLAGRGLAVPEVVLCVERADEEVLGLELVPVIGIEPGDVDDLLRLVAALNAITDAPAAIANLRPGMPQSAFEQLVRIALDDVAARWPDLGSSSWLPLYRTAVRA